MRNPVFNMTINRESLEMYAYITKVLGENADSFSKDPSWTFIDGLYISIKMVQGEDYPSIFIQDDYYDRTEKVYQIIGYAHYHKYEVICDF